MTEMLAKENNIAVTSGIQTVETAVAKTAQTQSRESIKKAIQSFSSITFQNEQLSESNWSALISHSNLNGAATVDPPHSYFMNALQFDGNLLESKTLVPLNQIAVNLNGGGGHTAKEISSFFQTGIQEALMGLKIKVDRNLVSEPNPDALDELLTPQQMKNPNRARLQPSIAAVNRLFSTLKKMQGGVKDLQMNILRSVRA